MRGALSFLLAVLVGAGTFLLLKTGNASEEKAMDSMISALKGHQVEHYVFTSEQGSRFLIVPKFGARIFAVSVAGENLFWTHPDVLAGQGGQRSWVAPEGGAKGFIFKPDWKGNRDFSMLDPGDYKVTSYQENEFLSLANTFQTTSNDGQEKYDLTLTREVRLEEDSLIDDPGFKGLKYDYLGLDFVHKLRNNSGKTVERILDLWCLVQIPPRGTMIVPVHDVQKEAWRTNYFEAIPEEFVKANPGSFSYYIHGSQRYKVGIRPESAKGAICYLSKTKGGDHYMVFMIFPVRPEGRYADRPKEEQETNGDAIQLYSHLEKGPLAFGELECHSWSFELPPGGEGAFPIKTYIYKGSLETLQKIGNTLIFPEFDKAYLFKID
jgi:hypothetical protein